MSPGRCWKRRAFNPNGEHAMEPIEAAVAAVYAEMAEKGLPDRDRQSSVTHLQAGA